MTDIQLPPRQKKIIQRKPDPSLSRSETSKKKLNHSFGALEHSRMLELSFISLKDSGKNTPIKNTSPQSTASPIVDKRRSPTRLSRLRSIQEEEKPRTMTETIIKTKAAFNVKDFQNTLDTLNDIKIHNQILRLKSQNDTLTLQNNKLKQQNQMLKKDKGITNNARSVDVLSKYKKENQQMKYQCLYMTSTITELQQKLVTSNQQYSHLKGNYNHVVAELQLLNQSKSSIQSINKSLIESCNSLKVQVQNLGQQVRYLNISLGIKKMAHHESNKAQQENGVADQLRKRNKQLQNRIIQLKQKVLIDEIVELTPEKDKPRKWA